MKPENNNNISFLLEEKKTKTNDKSNGLEQIVNFLNDDINNNDLQYFKTMNLYDNDINDLQYFKTMKFYNNDNLFYNILTKPDLIKICQYYKITNYISSGNNKKQYIIDTIIFYESLSENYEKVQKRHKLWAFMTELMKDKYMKKTIIWN